MVRLRTIQIFILCFLLIWSYGRAQTSVSSRGGGTQVILPSLSNFRNGVSAAMGNTSLSALFNELSFVNNIAQLPLSNQTGGVGLSYTPYFPFIPLANQSNWFQLNFEGYYVFGENFHKPSTEKLAAIYECYKVNTSSLRDVRGRVLSYKQSGYMLRRQALTLKATYYSRGTIKGLDVNGHPIGDFSPYDFNLALGYSINLLDNFSIGVALRYINSTIFTAVNTATIGQTITTPISSNSFSGDAYFLYDIPFKDHEKGGLTLSLILGNIGTKIDFPNGLQGYQPAFIDFGVSFTNTYSPEHAFHYTFDFKKSLVHSLPSRELLSSENLDRYVSLSVDQSILKSLEEWNNFTLNAGFQYVYKALLFGRLGFEFEQNPYEQIYKPTIGVGVSLFRRLNFDLAYWLPFGQSAITNLSHSFSLSASVEF